MIEPLLKDDGFLADVRSARSEPHALHLWWLGQSGFLLQYAGSHLLLDPYLSDSLTTKYHGTSRPHVRMTARVIAPERLSFIDVVTSSHNHTDHLDAETLLPLFRVNPKLELVIPEANRKFVADRLGLAAEVPRGINAGQRCALGRWKLSAVPAAHPKLEKDEWGNHKYLGYIVQAGPWTIYHSGDTLLYDGMLTWLTRTPIHAAILPINGDRPERGVAGNMNGAEAARLGHDMRAGLVIPCHFEMFEFNTASPGEFMAVAEKFKQPFRVLRAGERLTLGSRDLQVPAAFQP